MKKRIISKLNNAGNTLVIVLVVVAFMTVLGTVAVTSAMVGYKMKLVDKEVKRTFYSAEEVVDEIYSGLGMKTMKTLQGAYMNVLSNVTVSDVWNGDVYKKQVTNNEANRMLREKFTEDLIYAFTETAWTSKDSMASIPGTDKFLELINKEIIESPKLAKAVCVGNISVTKKTVDKKDYYTLKFTDLTVEYRTNNEADADDTQTYFSRVTFDGVIDMDKYVNFATDTINSLREFEKFSIVGCRGVDLNEGSSVTSSGSIYAGVGSISPSNNESEGGLVINKNATLSVVYDEDMPSVISKGRIFVNSAIFKAASANVWCVDLITSGSGSEVDIAGDTYVMDDTEINGDNSSIKFSGNYYGFSKDSFAVGSNNLNSSAIIVNGSNTKVDLLGIDTLLLAGRAYIDYSKKVTDEKDYLTGQSLALKGNQEVYLVPESFMTEPGVENRNGKDVAIIKTAYNPVSSKKDIVWKKTDGGAAQKVFDVEDEENVVTILLNGDNFFGYEYLAADNPFRVVKVAGRNYVYFNFKSTDAIKQYYDAIFSSASDGKSQEWIASRDYMRTLLKNNVNELNQSAILNLKDKNMTLLVNGSLINATPDDLENGVDGSVNGVAGAGADKLATNAIDMSNRYKLAYRTLLILPLEKDGERDLWEEIPDKIVVDEYLADLGDAKDDTKDTTPFTYYVNEDNMASYCNGSTSREINDGTKLIYVNMDVDDNYEIPSTVTSGIVLTTGNVTVKGNFSGLIMAKGKVTVDGTASLDNVATTVILDGNKELRDCFKAYTPGKIDDSGSSSEAGTMLNLKYEDLITFENWRKQSPTTTSTVLEGEDETQEET